MFPAKLYDLLNYELFSSDSLLTILVILNAHKGPKMFNKSRLIMSVVLVNYIVEGAKLIRPIYSSLLGSLTQRKGCEGCIYMCILWSL